MLSSFMMNHAAKRIANFRVDQDIQFHQIAFLVALELIIQLPIALGDGFDPVIEIHDNFG